VLLGEEDVGDGSLAGDFEEGVLEFVTVVCENHLLEYDRPIFGVLSSKARRTSVVQLDDFVVGLGLVESGLGGLAVGAPRLGKDHYCFTHCQLRPLVAV
jgi:hypothetical protein